MKTTTQLKTEKENQLSQNFLRRKQTLPLTPKMKEILLDGFRYDDKEYKDKAYLVYGVCYLSKIESIVEFLKENAVGYQSFLQIKEYFNFSLCITDKGNYKPILGRKYFTFNLNGKCIETTLSEIKIKK